MAVVKSEYLIEVKVIDGKTQATINGVKVSLKDLNKVLKDIKSSSSVASSSIANVGGAAEDASKKNENLISSSGLAGATLVETGRLISDLPFGITAVTNNLSQLSTLFVTLISKTKGAGKAFKLLGKQLMGPLGFILVFQVVISLIQAYQKEIIGFIKGTDEGRRAAEAFARALKQKGGFIAELKIAEQVMKDNEEGSEAYQGALAKLKNNGFDPATESVEEFIKKQFELAIIQAEMEQFTERESKRRAEEQKILDEIAKKEIYLAKLKVQGVRDLVQEYDVAKLKERIEEINAASAADIEGISSRAAIAFKDVVSDVSEGRPSKLKSIFGFSLPSGEELQEIMDESKNQLQKITDSMREKKEELDAEDEAARIELRRTRAIADIEAITNDEVAKREAILATNAYYDSLEEARKEEQAAKDTARRNKMMEQRFDDLARLFGEETKFGRASLLLKMNFANIEKAINDGVTWESLKNSVVTGATDFFEGVGKAAKAAPFPLNLPLIAGQIATASPFLLQLKAAVGLFKGKKKGSAPSISGVGGAGAGAAPQIQAPDFNVVGATAQSQLAETIAGAEAKPTRAYVVGKDITTQQELDRNITNTASFG